MAYAYRGYLLLFFLFLFFLSFFKAANAERYSVSEDGFGNFTAKKVEVSDVVVPLESSLIIEGRVILNEKPELEKNIDLKEAEQENTQIVELKSASLEKAERKISVFEQKYLEAEKKAKAKVRSSILDKKLNGPAYDATEVDPVDFIDADNLLQQGRNLDDKSPYYVTVDENGIPTTTFYDPVFEKELSDKRKERNINYTKALIFKRPSVNNNEVLMFPAEADPIATQILNSGAKEVILYFDSFAEHCCRILPNRTIPSLASRKSHYFTLNREELPYRFNEGDSRYLLLSLPSESNENYPLRLRTFIREHKRKSVAHGVFFPQLVTLDKDKKPLRIITGPLLRYHAETWATHGYLEGVFEIDRSKELDERYVLVNTTRDALKKSSTIESDGKMITIEHMGVGSIEFRVLAAN